jgi:hypothetical protein
MVQSSIKFGSFNNVTFRPIEIKHRGIYAPGYFRIELPKLEIVNAFTNLNWIKLKNELDQSNYLYKKVFNDIERYISHSITTLKKENTLINFCLIKILEEVIVKKNGDIFAELEYLSNYNRDFVEFVNYLFKEMKKI